MYAEFNARDVVDKFDQSLFDTLVGCEFDLYGVDGNCFCIGNGASRMVLEAMEDPGDGYRSYFGCFRVTDVGKIFFRSPVARVKLVDGGLAEKCHFYDSLADLSEEKIAEMKRDFTGWSLVDVASGHAWLTVGTDYSDGYYPCFTFRYQPDPTKLVSPA